MTLTEHAQRLREASRVPLYYKYARNAKKRGSQLDKYWRARAVVARRKDKEQRSAETAGR